MKRVINKVKLYVKNNKKSKDVANLLEKELLKYNFEITYNDYDLAISIGGDGTFLKMVKENEFNSDIYYVGINSGTLGFLQEIDLQDTNNFAKRLNINDFKEELLSVEETFITTNEQENIYYSLNEIVIRKSDFKILKTPIYIDKELFEEFNGDGLLISTSTGSTAYNMSFHGPIIYNTLKTLLITPIAPINNKVYQTLTNSIIIPEDKIIEIIPNNKTNLFIQVDGKAINLNGVEKIESKISKKKIKCLRMNDYHFIHIVNSKILK